MKPDRVVTEVSVNGVTVRYVDDYVLHVDLQTGDIRDAAFTDSAQAMRNIRVGHDRKIVTLDLYIGRRGWTTVTWKPSGKGEYIRRVEILEDDLPVWANGKAA